MAKEFQNAFKICDNGKEIRVASKQRQFNIQKRVIYIAIGPIWIILISWENLAVLPANYRSGEDAISVLQK